MTLWCRTPQASHKLLDAVTTLLIRYLIGEVWQPLVALAMSSHVAQCMLDQLRVIVWQRPSMYSSAPQTDWAWRTQHSVVQHGKYRDQLPPAISSLCAGQYKAGAQLLQVFESWGGELPPHLFAEFVLPRSERREHQ